MNFSASFLTGQWSQNSPHFWCVLQNDATANFLDFLSNESTDWAICSRFVGSLSSANCQHCWSCALRQKPQTFWAFANENWMLRNEPNWMWHLRETRLKISPRNPLSAEVNDASAWRISMPVVHLLSIWDVTSLWRQLVSCDPEQNVFQALTLTLTHALGLDECLLLSWASFFSIGALHDWCLSVLWCQRVSDSQTWVTNPGFWWLALALCCTCTIGHMSTDSMTTPAKQMTRHLPWSSSNIAICSTKIEEVDFLFCCTWNCMPCIFQMTRHHTCCQCQTDDNLQMPLLMKCHWTFNWQFASTNCNISIFQNGRMCVCVCQNKFSSALSQKATWNVAPSMPRREHRWHASTFHCSFVPIHCLSQAWGHKHWLLCTATLNPLLAADGIRVRGECIWGGGRKRGQHNVTEV